MYSFKSRVRYSEVNREGKLDIPSVIDYFQDCSTFQSESLHVGVDYLKKTHRAWLLNSWQVEFLKDAALLEDIEIGTWSYGGAGVYGYRNFVLNDGNGERLVNADSLWVFVDTESGRPVRVQPADIDVYGREPKIPMTDYGRKIKVEGEGEKKEPVRVRKYHIDTNGHVNNAVYIRLAMEYLTETKIKTLRVEYKHSAVYGDVIYPTVYEEADRLTVALNNDNDDNFARVQFIY